MIRAALVSGQWGRVGEHVEHWERYITDLVDQSGQAVVYRGWLDTWRRAQADPDQVAAWLGAYENHMTTIFETCGFDLRGRGPASVQGTPEERADLYCARRHAWQTDLAGRVRAFKSASKR